jgi:NAD(P)H dehydrogenase (quinone)
LGRVPEGEWRAKVSTHRASSPWAHAFKQAEGAPTIDSSDNRVLVAGVPGRVGGVGSAIVEILRRGNLPVRALVLREDQHTDALRANVVDVDVGDLTRARDVAGALSGCRRMYFGMSVSPSYLEATVTTAAVARERSDLEVLVNISQ